MNNRINSPGRRQFLRSIAALSAASAIPAWALPQSRLKQLRRIPGTAESIPVIGMGSWGTFDIGSNDRLRNDRTQVLQQFFDHGGALVDSSPMYGSSEANIGRCLQTTGSKALFSATKVWVLGQDRGIEQMQTSASLWGLPRFDLMQIHNFMDWQSHLQTLRRWKAEGQVRYIGITTSHGRRAEEMASVIAGVEDLDFIQITYNLADREAEKRLLPMALDKGKAVIINRPFQRKQLINRVSRSPLPDWASEIDCVSWPQLLLKFIVSHPAVTCAIPATSRVDHMVENMAAGYGPLPNAKMRQELIEYFEGI